MHLRRTTVDDDEVRGVGEFPRGSGSRVDKGTNVAVRSLSSGHSVTVLDEAAQPTRKHLVHRGEVVGPLKSLDDETTVLRLTGHTVFEDHHRPDDIGALDMGDVVGLHP